MKIRIDAGGREVEVEMDDVVGGPSFMEFRRVALETWLATAAPEETTAAFGYQAERRATSTVSPMGMEGAPGVVR